MTCSQTKQRKLPLLNCLFGGLIFGLPIAAAAQNVRVTIGLETNIIAVGQTTTLSVLAQIVPEQRANSDRIFSWYVDLINLNGGVARIQAEALQKPASDNDPRTSSRGTTNQANLRAIYDTFLNLPGAGKDNPVLLFTVPVSGLAPGKANFRIEQGSGAALSSDLIVAPLTGTEPLTGGDYSLASVELAVEGEGPTRVGPLQITHSLLADGKNRVSLTFTPLSGKTQHVEFRDQLVSGSWQALAGSPHNSGAAIDTNAVPQRFYRIRVE